MTDISSENYRGEKSKFTADETPRLPIPKSKWQISTRSKIGLFVLMLILLTFGITMIIFFMSRPETKVHQYKETQYEVLVRTNITVISGTK